MVEHKIKKETILTRVNLHNFFFFQTIMSTGIQQYKVYYFQSTECTDFCTSFNTGIPNSSRRDDDKTDVVNMQVRDVTLHTAAVLQNDDLKYNVFQDVGDYFR